MNRMVTPESTDEERRERSMSILRQSDLPDTVEDVTHGVGKIRLAK